MAYSIAEIGLAVQRRIATEQDCLYDHTRHCECFTGIVNMVDGTRYSVSCDWPDGNNLTQVFFDIEEIATD